ncbi:MAG: hypothetical protein WCX16_05385 [Candidatus Omnitrophota bacterium]
MDKLSAIFENPDPKSRRAQLSDLARSLNINLTKVKNEKDDVDENRLAVLIFEELKNGQKKKQQRLMIVILGIAFFILGTIIMYAASQVVMSTAKPSQGFVMDEE